MGSGVKDDVYDFLFKGLYSAYIIDVHTCQLDE